MVLAAEHPELVRSLALGSTASRVDPACSAVLQKWIRLAEDGSSEALYLDFGEHLYPLPVYSQLKDSLISASKNVLEEDLRRFMILAAGTENFDFTDRLDEIRCPVLVLSAADDAVLGPDAARVMVEKLHDKPGFRSFLYSGYGHAAFDTAPDYQERLLRFFWES